MRRTKVKILQSKAARAWAAACFHIFPLAPLLVLVRTYPFMRELMFVYLGAEAFFLCTGRSTRSTLLDWARAALCVLLLAFLWRPVSFFHANIAIAVLMALLAAACAAEAVKRAKGKKRMGRKGKAAAVVTAAGALCYLILGILISGFSQPKISDEFVQNLDVSSFYGSGPSSDRAVIIEDNAQALMERVRMIRNAKERLILSTFDFRDDKSGRIMLAALLAAADRGVRVQVVVDGVSGLLRMEQNPYFFALSAHPDAEIRIYNKINPLKPWALMGRLHDKYLIADHEVYLLGGRNTFSYFLGNSEGHINYDRDVLIYHAAGNGESSLSQVEAYFQGIWEHKATSRYHDAESISRRASVKKARKDLDALYEQYIRENPAVLEAPDYMARTYSTQKVTLLSNPTGTGAKEPTVFCALAALMANAKESVSIHTPYIICNEMMYDAFRQISAAVPEARLMTNSAANNGNPFGAGDYRKHFNQILATGLALYEYEGGVSYHGKSIAIDDRISVIGSFNMDMRSVYLDTELMLVIDSEGLNAQLREIMEGYEKESARVLANGSRVYPEGVVPQELSARKKLRMDLLYRLLSWARRLL